MTAPAEKPTTAMRITPRMLEGVEGRPVTKAGPRSWRVDWSPGAGEAPPSHRGQRRAGVDRPPQSQWRAERKSRHAGTVSCNAGGACDGERDASCALRANEARQARHAKLEHPDEQDEDGEEGDRAACSWLLPRVSRRGARDSAHRERRKDEREEEAADVADRERAE